MNQFRILVLACLAISMVMVGLISAKSECEIKREQQDRAQKAQEKAGGGAAAILVPKCNSDGTYAKLQCHAGSPFCQCWDPEGKPVTSPKKGIKKCECLETRFKELNKIPASQQGDNQDVTSCELDGAYTKRQCNRSACWCVNQDTGAKLTDENRNKSAVKC